MWKQRLQHCIMMSSNDNYKLRENCDNHCVRFITAVSLLFQSLVYSTFGKSFIIYKKIFLMDRETTVVKKCFQIWRSGMLHKKMKFSFKNFFSKSFLRIWSHLLKKSLMENFIFGPVYASYVLSLNE